MSKITVAADATGVTKEDTNILTDVLNGATSVIKAFGEESAVFYNEQSVGRAVLAATIGGIVLGDRLGDKIPFLGGNR